MVKRDELIKFIYKIIGEEWLKKAEEKDEVANGVQILGKEEVKKVSLGVSVNEEFLQKVVEEGSNFCIFHHGFDPRTYKSRYPTYSQKRLKIIFQNGITIIGFHYCLDAHPEIGNNATIIKKLGAKIKEPLFGEWGYAATFSKKRNVYDLAHECNKLFGHEVFAVVSGPHEIKKIGVVSGAGKPDSQRVAEMEKLGVELFITGESSESIPHMMKESKINYFACGHYATEAFGVKELGKKIKSHFGKNLDVEFIDIKNPI
jgi:dinuclear metal center YbgI/SA1388 family protein